MISFLLKRDFNHIDLFGAIAASTYMAKTEEYLTTFLVMFCIALFSRVLEMCHRG